MRKHPPSCTGCPLNTSGKGFLHLDGEGRKGVLLVGEAAGEHEAQAGVGLVGKAGYYTFSNLARVGLERDDFWVANTLCCQPPSNKLAKMWYEKEAILHCAPNLDASIKACRESCEERGLHFTILTLGRIAFKRVMDLEERRDHALLTESYLNYPFWSERYQSYVIAAHHPSYLMRGNHHLLPTLQFAATRAVEIAENGVTFDTPTYLLDPSPFTFATWVEDFRKVATPSTILSYDIETPFKSGKDEEKVAREDDPDYTILRISFAYKPGEAVSIPWNASYLPYIERLFSTPCTWIGWNNLKYDSPRVRAQVEIVGNEIDAMDAWHVLNSTMPKGLGFVAPHYWQSTPMWKHLSSSQPAFYNAKDADAALRCWNGIEADLKDHSLWGVFERHVIKLGEVLTHMSRKGVRRDEEGRGKAEKELSTYLDGIEAQMEGAVPLAARRLKVFKSVPKELKGLEGEPLEWAIKGSDWLQVERLGDVKRCEGCGALNPLASHFKPLTKRAIKEGKVNPCEGLKKVKGEEKVLLWAKPLDFKVSGASLTSYQSALKHQAIMNRREGRVTFDEDAIKQLIRKHPLDLLYPLILQHRGYQKLLGVYIGVTGPNGVVSGGMRVGRDGLIHPLYTHNPSTLRLSCQNPNMQQVPARDPYARNLVKNLIIASLGCRLIEFDFSAIEAVLVGYFASDPDYIRLAKLGIHAYLASHVLDRPADLSWSDKDLRAYFGEIKHSTDPHTNHVYNGAKRGIHLSGYGGTPHKMHLSEPDVFRSKEEAERLQGLFFDLFPKIPKWHTSTRLQAEKDGFLRNPYGYVHRFNHVFKYEKVGGEWVKSPDPSGDANSVLAFLPQSTAAGIIKEVMIRLFFDHFNEAGQFLRLQVHDSLLFDTPEGRMEEAMRVISEEMTAPIPELALPASYHLGPFLSIGVESKSGTRWGELA